MTNKIILRVWFLISFIAFLLNANLEIWTFLILIYFILLIVALKDKFKYSFPLGEFIALVFFIDNTFSLTILHLLLGSKMRIGDFQYSQIEIIEYLPFSFLASQALIVGFQVVKPFPGTPWLNFLTNFDKLINKNNLRFLIGIGFFGIFLQLFKLTPFISFLLTSFFNCGVIGFALYTKKPTNIYILAGLAVSILSAYTSGMFGNLIYFIVYYIMLYILVLSASGKKINAVKMGFAVVIGVYFLAFIQNVKTDYRAKIWSGKVNASSEAFYSSVNTNTKNPLDVNFYIPILLRLNQGYIVTAAMYKVPFQEPFANGSTIITSIIDAFVPRIINTEKEEAGGREKIKRFTNIVLVGTTSMNLGLLGEAYVNFGKLGSVLLFFIYGFLIAKFEKLLLGFSLKFPVILVFFPIYFQFLVGSGSDFLMVFNGIIKSSILIFAIILIFNWQKKQRLLELRDAALQTR